MPTLFGGPVMSTLAPASPQGRCLPVSLSEIEPDSIEATPPLWGRLGGEAEPLMDDDDLRTTMKFTLDWLKEHLETDASPEGDL